MSDEKTVHLGLADLRLLMDNYQNIIKMTAVLLEQQKQVIDLQHQTLSKQDIATTKQLQVCNSLENIIGNINTCNEKVVKSADAVEASTTAIKEKINKLQISTTTEHSGINNRIYISMGGMITIIISLIGLLTMFYNRFELIHIMHDSIQNILTHLGI
jgi:hypothetical protein